MRHLKGVFPIKTALFSRVFQKSVISAFLSSEAVSIAGQPLFMDPQSFLSPGKWLKQYALKGQKLLAQGNALGIMSVSNAPCKGNSFKIHIIKKDNPLRYVKLFPIVLKLLPLQGALFATHKNPGRCPGLGASALSGRVAYMGFLAFWVCCLYWLLGLQGVLLIWAFNYPVRLLILAKKQPKYLEVTKFQSILAKE